MARVRLKALSKTYEGSDGRTLEALDLDVANEEFVVLVGPSGCGKSTTLRLIAGLETPSAGEIWIGDRRVDPLDPSERDIAMVFQNYALYPHMTVAQNMSFGLRLAKMPKAEIKARVEEAASILGLGDYLERRPKALSGGQRQRVAMGRAIVRHPQVFLFDEPLSNLDAQLRGQMRAEIRRLHKRLRATTIYVTHDQVESMTLADRVVVLNGGRIEQQGSPQELYAAPATRFVAGFIGSPAMNFLPARVEAGQLVLPGAAPEGGDLRLDLPGRDLAGLAGRALEAGIRPEHLLPASPEAAHITPRLDLVEALGATTLAHFTLGGSAVSALLPPDACRGEGTLQPLCLRTERIVLFDAASGRAI